MKKKGIIEILEDKKQQLLNEINAEKENRIQNLEQDYQEKLQKLQQSHENQVKSELRKKMKFQLSKKRLELMHRADQEKVSLINDILKIAREKLANIDTYASETYYTFLNGIIKTNLQKYRDPSDSIILHIRGKDQKHLNLDEEGITIRTDLDELGSKLSFEEKSIELDDTVLVRFESSRRKFLKELNHVLFGEVTSPELREEQIIEDFFTNELET